MKFARVCRNSKTWPKRHSSVTMFRTNTIIANIYSEKCRKLLSATWTLNTHFTISIVDILAIHELRRHYNGVNTQVQDGAKTQAIGRYEPTMLLSVISPSASPYRPTTQHRICNKVVTKPNTNYRAIQHLYLVKYLHLLTTSGRGPEILRYPVV